MDTFDLGYRILERQDIEFARLLHNADETLLYLSDIEHISEPQQEEWFNAMSKSDTSRRYLVFDVAKQTKIAVFRVDNLDWKRRSVCVGLDIAPNFRGNGLSYPIYKHFINYFFNECGLNRVYLGTLGTNERAQKLYGKLGFVIEGKWREALYRNGEHADLLWMSMLRDEFNSFISKSEAKK